MKEGAEMSGCLGVKRYIVATMIKHKHIGVKKDEVLKH